MIKFRMIVRYAFCACLAVAIFLFPFWKFQHNSFNVDAEHFSLTDGDVGEFILQPGTRAINDDWKAAGKQLVTNLQGTGRVPWRTLTAGKKQDYTIVLPDGRLVHLNYTSTLKFISRFIDKREVYVTGKAFFDIKQNQQHLSLFIARNLLSRSSEPVSMSIRIGGTGAKCLNYRKD